MVNWKLIVTQLTDKYHSPGFGSWTEEHLGRTWASLFDFRPGAFHDPVLMHGNRATVYNYIMTLVRMEDANDQEKVEKIVLLLENIVGQLDISIVSKILRKGGYTGQIPEMEESIPVGTLRGMHPEIIAHCAKLFKEGYHFTCINEACKAYNKKVQEKSGSDKDGSDLMQSVFSEKGKLRINAGITDTEKNEQQGFQFLSAGMIKMFRNPTSHETASSVTISPQECIEILGLISYLFRQLDNAKLLP